MKADQLDINYSTSIFDIPLITVNGDTLKLSDTLKAKVNVVELFFVGCVPCEQKASVLKKVIQKYDNKDVMVINICSGAHTSISTFKEYSSKKKYNGSAFFYSPDSTLGKVYGKNLAFPFEQVISNKRELIMKEVGYDPTFEEIYIKNKIRQIEKYNK